MSKKIGVLGITLSLAVGASLVSDLALITENKEIEAKVSSLKLSTEENLRVISEQLKKYDNNSNVDYDVETLSTRMVEFEEQITKLQNDFDTLPSFVQLNGEGEVVDKITKPVTTPNEPVKTEPEPSNTKPIEPSKPIAQVEPTKENPVFKTSDRLNFRADASIKAKINKTFAKGETLTWLELSVEKDGYTWIKVKDSKGNTGWVAKQYTTKTN